MIVRWSKDASRDAQRLTAFLEPVAPSAAAQLAERLTAATRRLAQFPRMGAPIIGYEDRQEVRRLIIGDYELRYEIIGETIEIVRIWHQREDR